MVTLTGRRGNLEIHDESGALVAYKTPHGWVKMDHPFQATVRLVLQLAKQGTTPKQLVKLINERLSNPVDPSEE